jgi:ArsR family transcriptional regulator
MSVDTEYRDNIDGCQYTVHVTDDLRTLCCAPISESPLSQDDAEGLAAVLKAVADPARLRLLSLIQAQPAGEACVCNVTEPLGLSQPTVSHHLKVLHGAGLLDRDRRGNWVYYRVIPERMAALRSALT